MSTYKFTQIYMEQYSTINNHPHLSDPCQTEETGFQVGNKVIIIGQPNYASDESLPIGSIGTIGYLLIRYKGTQNEYTNYVILNRKANTTFGNNIRGTVYNKLNLCIANDVASE